MNFMSNIKGNLVENRMYRFNLHNFAKLCKRTQMMNLSRSLNVTYGLLDKVKTDFKLL